MKSRYATFVVICAVIFGLSLRAEAAPIVNGGFETGDFTGWTLSGNIGFGTGVCLAGSNFNGSVCSTHSGSYSAVSGPFGTSGFVSQTLLTTPGDFYDLSFFLRNDSLGAAPANAFVVHWDGGVIYQLLNAADQGFTGVSLTHLLATTANTSLSFEFVNNPGGFFLDDVSVAAVPEPASLTLLATGLAFGVRRLRRR